MKQTRNFNFMKIVAPIATILALIFLFVVFQQNNREMSADLEEAIVNKSPLGNIGVIAVHPAKPDNSDRQHSETSNIFGDNKHKTSFDNSLSVLLSEVQAINDYSERETAFIELGDELIIDRELVEDLLNQIERIEDRVFFTMSVVKSIFEQEPDDAAAYVNAMDDGALKDTGNATIAILWIDRQDPIAASYWCEQIYQPSEKTRIGAIILDQWVKEDPETANIWFNRLMSTRKPY